MSVLGDLLVKTVADQVPDRDAERIVRHVAFGRGLILGGSKTYG